ncbi:MAG: putative addiction module component (TIGR02574 family) [Oleiphilaceae bacterium]|jgi:putative addiction module component (TIGR02574 family)
MTHTANSILNQALELSASERVDFVKKLLFSLDSPDTNIDAIWAKEADARIEAYDRGEIETVSATEVFDKYRKS